MGIDVGGCLHGHDMERCKAEGCSRPRGDEFCVSRYQMNIGMDLYMEGVARGGQGQQMVVILGYAGAR